MRRLSPTFLVFVLCGLLKAVPASADTFEGTVTKVTEGEVLRVRDKKGKQHLFRLLGADAPNKGQLGYTEAQKQLNQRALDKVVMVDWLKTQVCPPRGGSCAQLAKILLRGEDLALRQIRRGLAWHDIKQLREQSTTDKTLYADAQLQARLHKRGIWQEKDPVPPWEYVSRAAPTKKSTKK